MCSATPVAVTVVFGDGGWAVWPDDFPDTCGGVPLPGERFGGLVVVGVVDGGVGGW